MVPYVEVWNLAVGREKMEISGVDSAWHLVNSSWSQRVGKWRSDKEESFFQALKELVAWRDWQAAEETSEND